MKRITSGVLAVLMFATVFCVEAVPVFADPADQVQEITETTEATQATEATEATQPTETTTPPAGDSTEPTNPPQDKEELPEKEQYDGQKISAEGMRILKLEEGFSEKPYWDYTQWTVGYGTCCPDDKLEEYKKNGISEEAAEILLHNHLIGVYKDLANFAKKNSLTFNQGQFDALVLFSYNCGTGWTYDASGTLPTALRKGATGSELIRSEEVV